MPAEAENLLVGLDPADDAAVYRLDDERALVFTIDFFPPIVDDPDDFGAIAATNALNDVFAMGGAPLLALSVAALPEELPTEVVRAIFDGADRQVRAAGAILAGGHTIRDAEPKYGLAVVGTVALDGIWPKSGAQAGDALYLTKPLGTALVLGGAKRGLADAGRGGALDAHAEPRRGRRAAALRAERRHRRHGLRAARPRARDGERAAACGSCSTRRGCRRSTVRSRRRARASRPRARATTASTPRSTSDDVAPELVELAYDPQTAGGLLVSLPARQGAWRSRRSSPRAGALPGPDRHASSDRRPALVSEGYSAARGRRRPAARAVCACVALARARSAGLALANAVMLVLIVATGATVRLTGSGLGCEHWPGCQPHHFEPKSFHSYIEFSNRVVAFLTILRHARDLHRRAPGAPLGTAALARVRDLLRHAAQAPLGALTVHYHLNPWLVLSHFLLSLVVLTLGRRARARGRAGAGGDAVPAWVPRLGVARRSRAARARRQRHARDRRRPAPGQHGRAAPLVVRAGGLLARARDRGLRALVRGRSLVWLARNRSAAPARRGSSCSALLAVQMASARSSTGRICRGGSCSSTSRSRRRSGRR